MSAGRGTGLFAAGLLALAACAAPALGAAEAADKGAAAGKPAAKPAETAVVTRRTVTIDGKPLAYTATAGTLILKDDKGEPRAELSYVAYVKDGGGRARPVTFTFNGGPGSSSVWLHLGTFGPRRVAFADAAQPPPAPYGFVDNAHSILDVTDLVFIDPVGTGWSRALGEAKAEEFWGVKEDVRAVGDFIRLWTTRHDRWQSPKFLAGESYGTTRAAALVNHLQNNEGMTFNGVILVSSILNFQTARFDTGNDLPYVTFLPTFAATAWHHDMVADRPATLEAFLAEARAFAAGDYAQALMKGAKLGAAEADAVATRLARFTGLPKAFVVQANLRISIQRFTKALLRERRLTVGRLDSRYTGIDDDAAGETPDFDPSLVAIMGPYTAALHDYARTELKVAEERKYEVLSGSVGGKWKWGDQGSGGGYVNVAEDLRQAMSRNPHLKVLVANGYYDLATPFFATEYTFDHLGLEPALLSNVTMTYYPAGHMMYVHGPSLARLKTDVAAFIAKATAQR